MKRLSWLAPSLLLATSIAGAQGISDERARELNNLLIQDCGSCHGLQMKGGLGPALLPQNLHGKSADYLSAVILHGRPGTAMPPWKALLSETEARWIAERLLERGAQ